MADLHHDPLWLRALQHPCPPPPLEAAHAWAAFEQGAWLAELELLQLGDALRRRARQGDGYQGELFDVMLTIADVLEREHGWSPSQSDAWLERMGLWEEL